MGLLHELLDEVSKTTNSTDLSSIEKRCQRVRDSLCCVAVQLISVMRYTTIFRFTREKFPTFEKKSTLSLKICQKKNMVSFSLDY